MPERISFDHYQTLTREDGSPVELGRGAMGITYKAFDTNLRVNVALKVINSKLLESSIAQQRFLREARAAAQLRHPNVASVFHLGTSGNAFYYAMEFVDGETLESFIRREGPVSPVMALRITLQVTRALAAATRHHLVHRDIKPANLMLVKDDDEFLVKVIDFGLAKSIKHTDDEDLATLSMGGFVGTAHFASPEQLEEKEIDVRSDIYSLGVTLWYMLAGQVPFGGSLAQVMSQHLHKPPPLERLQNVPACLRALVAHMIEKNPLKRPQTPVELRIAIEKCLAQVGSEQNFPAPIDEARAEIQHERRVRPNVARAILWSIAAVVVLLGFGALLLFKRNWPTGVRAPRSAVTSPFSAPVPSSVPLGAQSVSPGTAPASPRAASSPEEQEVWRTAIAEAQKYEAAHDWPAAVAAYVRLQKNFPQKELGRVNLEFLLSKLRSEDTVREDNFEALRGPLTEAAKMEIVSAMEMLGDFLRQRDPKASFDWLCAAAARGRAHAMTEVGLRFSNGAGVDRDFVKAAQWFEQGRAAGDVAAGMLLAECYLLGKGVSKNSTKAVALLQNAASANDPRAMDRLANCYHKGIGTDRNDREAFRLYSAASRLNYLDSMGNLGVLYLTSDETDLGKDQAKRTEKAVNLFRDGARQNNALCMYLYARCLEAGTGVSADAQEAAVWYRHAANSGNPAAQEWCRQHNLDPGSNPSP